MNWGSIWTIMDQLLVFFFFKIYLFILLWMMF